MTDHSLKTDGGRRLYTYADLRRLIDPKTVALVGASETKGSFGQRTIANMGRFTGRLHLINPKYGNLAGRPCFPSVQALPEVPDCVIAGVPQDAVLPLVEECGKAGVGGLIVYASGFAETGIAERKAAEREVARAAAGYGLRVAGPNCVGLYNIVSGAAMSFMPEFDENPLVRGKVAIISQSGALGFSVLQGMRRGVGISHYLACGNSADVDVADYINYLAEDPSTRSIACILEGVRDGARFLEAGRRVFDAGKTLLVYKTGRGEGSREVALSHTGSLIGSLETYEAALDRMGAVAVDDLSTLLESAAFFAKVRGVPAGRGVGIMSTSGGGAVIGADEAEKHGVALPPLAPQTQEAVAKVLPYFGRVGNPADLTAEVLKTPQTFSTCLEAFLADPGVSALVVPMVFGSRIASESRSAILREFAARHDKPIVYVWMNDWLDAPGVQSAESDERLVLCRSMDSCFRNLRRWFVQAERRARAAESRPAIPPDATPRARAVLSDAKSGVLTERESKRLLGAYGVDVTTEHLAKDVEDAVRAARRIGFPVAIKIESADIPHKTEAGVVRLGVADDDGVRRAYAEVMAAAAKAAPSARLNGVLVQEMAKPGLELVIGCRRDPQLGPTVMVGFGGVLVEVLRDTAIRLAPVSRDEARRMLASLRGARLLAGFRGQPPVALDALADAVSRASVLAAELADDVDQIDINPVIAGPERVVAVDGLVVRS